MKVLVTGASGFLGSHIVDKCLTQGDQVRVLLRETSDRTYLNTLSGLEMAFGDLLNLQSLHSALQGIEIVYHSAARVLDYGSRKQFYESNVVGTQNLLQVAKALGVKRFIFISSPSVVMDMKDQIGIDESYPYSKKFINLYSETKAAAEQLVLRANDSTPDRKFITCSLRPRAIWGPRDRNGFLPRILVKMAAEKIRDISGGKKTWASLCYCENAAYACTLAARSDSVGGKAYFITDQEPIDVWKFASSLSTQFDLPAIHKKMNPTVLSFFVKIIETLWKIPYLSNRFSPLISRYSVGLITLSSTFDIHAAERDFGYHPRVDHTQGLQLLKEWIEQIGGIQNLKKTNSRMR